MMLELFIRATVVLAGAMLGLLALKHASASIRASLLRIAIGTSLLLPLLYFAGLRIDAPVLARQNATPAPKIFEATTWSTVPEVPFDQAEFELVPSVPLPEQPFAQAIPTTKPSDSQPWLAWSLGAFVLFGYFGLGLNKLRQLLKSSAELPIRTQVEVQYALIDLGVKAKVVGKLGLVDSPVTFGVFRHVILLPQDFETWTEAHRKAALRHEAAHIKRFDCAWQWLATTARAVYWCHPLIWLVSRALRDEAELAADEQAIRSGVAATDYASTLVEIARKFKSNGGLVRSQGVSFMNKHQLDRRVRHALGGRRGFSFVGLLWAGVAFVTTSLLALAHPIQQEQTAASAKAPEVTVKATKTSDQNVTIASSAEPAIYEVTASGHPGAAAIYRVAVVQDPKGKKKSKGKKQTVKITSSRPLTAKQRAMIEAEIAAASKQMSRAKIEAAIAQAHAGTAKLDAKQMKEIEAALAEAHKAMAESLTEAQMKKIEAARAEVRASGLDEKHMKEIEAKIAEAQAEAKEAQERSSGVAGELPKDEARLEKIRGEAAELAAKEVDGEMIARSMAEARRGLEEARIVTALHGDWAPRQGTRKIVVIDSQGHRHTLTLDGRTTYRLSGKGTTWKAIAPKATTWRVVRPPAPAKAPKAPKVRVGRAIPPKATAAPKPPHP